MGVWLGLLACCRAGARAAASSAATAVAQQRSLSAASHRVRHIEACEYLPLAASQPLLLWASAGIHWLRVRHVRRLLSVRRQPVIVLKVLARNSVLITVQTLWYVRRAVARARARCARCGGEFDKAALST